MEGTINNNKIKKSQKQAKLTQIPKITIWRIFAYFIIYSLLGFIIETIYAFVVEGIIESRQSFLYGPLCAVYGLGAVVMIIFLNFFKNNNYILFTAGVIIGSITEYLISWVGEIWLNTRWWDYSDYFLNINGRICLVYSIMWGILAICLVRYINPQIDRFIDKLNNKVNGNTGKIIVTVVMALVLIDWFYSAAAENWVRTKVCIEKNIEVENKDILEAKYEQMYSNEKKKKFVDKYWTIEKVLHATPNITIQPENSERIFIKDLYPDIKVYFYKINID